MEADGEAFKVKLEEEEKEREVLRVVARKEREQVMVIMDMAEEADEKEKKQLVGLHEPLAMFRFDVSQIRLTPDLGVLLGSVFSRGNPSTTA